jgi:hypothetical protein
VKELTHAASRDQETAIVIGRAHTETRAAATVPAPDKRNRDTLPLKSRSYIGTTHGISVYSGMVTTPFRNTQIHAVIMLFVGNGRRSLEKAMRRPISSKR